MIMINSPNSTSGSAAAATFVIQTVHGNAMTVSIDQLPFAKRGRTSANRPTNDSRQGSTTANEAA